MESKHLENKEEKEPKRIVRFKREEREIDKKGVEKRNRMVPFNISNFTNPCRQATTMLTFINNNSRKNKSEGFTGKSSIENSMSIACRYCNMTTHPLGYCFLAKLEQETASSITTSRYNNYHTNNDRTVKVFPIPSHIEEAGIWGLFEFCGAVEKVIRGRNHDTGQYRGVAYVVYESEESAKKAIKKIHGHKYDNIILNVVPAGQ